MIRSILGLVLVLGSFNLYSQELQLFSSGGGTVSGGELTGSFSLGETIISSNTSGAFLLTQGFQQAFLFVVGVKPTAVLSQVEVFPNPANSYIYIKIPEYQGIWELSVFDINGRLQTQQTISGFDNDLFKLPLDNYMPGFYGIRIRAEGLNKIFTGSIIKI